MQEINLEYVFENVSVKMLWKQVATGSGLSSWFADRVDLTGESMTFVWGKSLQRGRVLLSKENQSFAFAFVDEDGGAQEEIFFTIHYSELTKDTTLKIVERLEEEDISEIKQLWENQIEKLRRKLGA